MVARLIENGFAYESNGSVYFDMINTTVSTIMVNFQEDLSAIC